MSDTLILHLGASTSVAIDWAVVRGGFVVHRGQLADASELIQLRPHADAADVVMTVLPGEQVASRPMATSPKQSAKALAAAKLLMEDELAESAAILQTGFAAIQTGLLVFAARESLISAWIDELARAGIVCDLLTADYFTLQAREDQALCLVRNNRAIVSVNRCGFAVEIELLPALNGAVFENVKSVTVLGHLQHGALLQFEDVEFVNNPSLSDDGVFELMAASAARAETPNFLQRRIFKRGVLSAAAAPWRRTPAFVATLVIALFLGVIADGADASREAVHWNKSALLLHAEAHPGSISEDPADFARFILAQKSGSGQFLHASRRLTAALAGHSDVEVDRLRFDASTKEFIATVRAPSDASIEALKASMAKSGSSIEDAGGYRRGGSFWTGELRIRLQ
jgi:type II secretion system protein L